MMLGRILILMVLFSILLSAFFSCLSLDSGNPGDEQENTDADPQYRESDPGDGEKEMNNMNKTDQEPTSGMSGNTGEEENTMTGLDPKPSPAPLHINEALRRIRKFVQPPEQLITNNNSFLYIVHDFTSDGIDEICVLGIESENPENARIEFLSDSSRLYATKMEVFPFYLYIFSIKQGVLQKLEKLKLGEQTVYESMTKFSLHKEKSDPAVITISFYTREGSVQQWLVFKRPRVLPISQLLLLDTFSSKALVEDINADGVIDIVLFERGMEEGIGYETFLTWKKWNGKGFVDYKTSNIVRNLNNFLLKIKELSLDGDISTLISYSFDPEERKKMEKKGLTEQEILFRFLGLSKYFGSGELPDFSILEDINDIIFPEILDNPFYIRDNKGFYVKLSFRIVYSDGIYLIPEVFIYMLKNPFEKQQFVLYPVFPDTVVTDE